MASTKARLLKHDFPVHGILQGSFGSFGPKSKKSLEKGSWGLLAPGAQKVRKEPKTELKP